MQRHDQIVRILQKVTRSDVFPAPEESLFESGLLDSFSLTDMVGELEREFGIQVPDTDLLPEIYESVNRIDQYIARQRMFARPFSPLPSADSFGETSRL